MILVAGFARRSVFTDCMVMHDAIDESLAGKIETGDGFRNRFGNPYAVIHRVDIHKWLLERAVETGRVESFTNTRIVNSTASFAAAARTGCALRST